MSSGAKITLMIIAAVLGLLAVYYGLISRSDDPLDPETAQPKTVVAQLPPPQTAAPSSSVPAADASRPVTASSGGGLLTESLDDAMAGRSAAPSTPPPASDQPIQTVADPLAPKAGTDRIAANSPIALSGQSPLAHDPVSARLPAASGPQPSLQSRLPAGASVDPPRATTYTVKEGDSLWTIAQQILGDGAKWDLIAKANPSLDPDHLRIGSKLTMPTREGGSPAGSPASNGSVSTNSPVSTAATYSVSSGDTLTSIARDLFGDSSKWRIIFDANKAVVGSDPNNLRIGMKLTVPPRTPRG